MRAKRSAHECIESGIEGTKFLAGGAGAAARPCRRPRRATALCTGEDVGERPPLAAARAGQLYFTREGFYDRALARPTRFRGARPFALTAPSWASASTIVASSVAIVAA